MTQYCVASVTYIHTYLWYGIKRVGSFNRDLRVPKNDKSEVDITIRLFPNAFFVLEYHVCAMPFKPVSCDHVV